jgi:predicted nuclease of predicted toxin-antitoxin system
MASGRKRDFHGKQMKFLLDMNLPPRWVQFFSDHGFECVHWSNVGEYTAKDSVIMAYAREKGYTVFTHDLDYGALLAATRGTGPSVIQIRTQNVVPEAIGDLVLNAIARFEKELEQGAFITIDPYRSRARVLPFRN